MVLIISFLIKTDSEGLLFYGGTRVGGFGEPFRMNKFRTMLVKADKIGGPSTSADESRLKKIRRWIRKYKLDESPKLINVLKGEMGFIGPRSEVSEQIELCTVEYGRAIPSEGAGMTDSSSVKFYNEGEILTWIEDLHQTFREKIQPEKIRVGLKYVKEYPFWIDLKVVFQAHKMGC